MKNDISLAAVLQWILDDLIGCKCKLEKKREHKIDLSGAPKKSKQNKIRRYNSCTHLIYCIRFQI